MRRRGGLDWFRLPAALLVIAIHTGPLSSLTETGDFFLTRVLGRVAVPFFFMVTGCFLRERWAEGWSGIRNSWRRTAALYAGATALYLPLMIYKGDFSRENLLWELFRDGAFNGTFYHLWYFPALLLGLPLTAALVRRLGKQRALGAAALLYLCGVLGDSWYGLTAQSAVLSGIYEQLFFFFDYTRNGLFFAPLFLLLGGAVAEWKTPWPAGRSAAALAAAFGLMTAEAFWLRSVEWLRHDSMYVSLPLVMLFLFSLLFRWKVRGGSGMSRLALALYVVHPWAIVLVRGGAKVLRLSWLLVDCTPVFYLAVCLLSAALSALGLAAWQKYGPRQRRVPRRAWVEVDRPALRHNLHVLQGLLEEGQRIMAVLKADGYGHGAVPLARLLEEEGVDAFAVATLEEGAALRRAGVRGSILILGYVPPEGVSTALRRKLTLTVVDEAHAAALEAEKRPVHVHWKVDTGMHRLGVDWEGLTETVRRCPHLVTDGVYTHLCVSDQLDPESRAFTVVQLERFRLAVETLKRAGVHPGEIHAQASYGLLHYTGVGCTLARVGIALYGVLSGPEDSCGNEDLEPALSLKARVTSVREIPSGEGAGYGLAFRPERQSRVAAVSIGYADGLPRSLSGRGHALVRGKKVPIAGRICMDQLLLNVTEVPEVKPGDEVIFLGRAGAERLTAEAVAAEADTISNELLSRMGPRLERVWRGK